MNIESKIRRFDISYIHVLGLGFGVLITSYLLVLLVDIMNIFGLRRMSSGIIPFYWHILFAERSLIEFTQWIMLTGLIVTSYQLFQQLSDRKEIITAKFWLIITITAVFMLIEDALNPRHFMFRSVLDLHWQKINIAETIYFGTLAAIPAYGFLRYSKSVREHKRTLIFLILGGLFYGAAVTISGPGHSFGVTYLGEVGLNLTASVGGEELQEAYDLAEQRLIEVHGNDHDDLAFMFTDHFIEESLELIGAIFLLSSAVSYLQFLRRKDV